MSIRTSRKTLVAGSAIALLLTGTAAAGTAFIDGAKLKPSSVTSKKIKNGTLTASDSRTARSPRPT